MAGFLLTLINKAKNKGGNPNNRMPSFGGEPPLKRPMARPLENVPAQPVQRKPAQHRPVERPEPAPQPAVYKSQLSSSSDEGISYEYNEPDLLQRTIDAEAPLKARTSAAATAGAARTARQTPSASDAFRVPQGEDLRRAFVMAEVLGPPRSKRPLRK
ncbi:hypothetical protein [Paenibacillus silvisoli]|uniref:hypothetical protein n=1 Tax=Paenibacillus silvisoli TaxID=3110539 RepID=UPI0028047ABA|nr:hypothetical protein [Paenibacillus silvisoli]